MVNNNLTEQEKIKLAKSAFARFKEKIDALMKRQNDVFVRIMDRISKRKLDEQRAKLDEVFKDKK